jgi:ketosteroid isomerase-like protein
MGLSITVVSAQKKCGTVFSEHEAIDKANSMWAAFASGDKETFLSFWADSVMIIDNGVANTRTKPYLEGNFDWWRDVENLTIVPDTPATPDAIEYKDGALWVQDWIRIKGIHKNTGIRIDLPFHYLYAFNKENKIYIALNYFNGDIFKAIDNSYKTKENGKIYINHPYIVTVRKLVNAYCAEDIETLFSIYSPDARFSTSLMKNGQTIGVEEKKKEDIQNFSYNDNILLDQIGYPDCIYYEQEDWYAVYSWWTMSFTTKDGKKKSDIPVMMGHFFNKEGKISFEMVYISSNHFE